MTEKKKNIRMFIVENFLFGNTDGFNDHTSFLETGIIDSTGVLELISFLEETFKIHVDDDELVPENLDSVDNVCLFLEKKMCGPKVASAFN